MQRIFDFTPPIPRKKGKKGSWSQKKNCILLLEAIDWNVCFQLQTEEKVMYEWRTIGSGLARQRKAWMVASTFDNMYIWKFDTHKILSCIGFVDCLLKVLVLRIIGWLPSFGIFLCLWTLSRKLMKWHLKLLYIS